jgi:hypothetical protein
LFSERRLRLVALLAVAGIALATVAFHGVQNREALTGGAVAWPKSVWLGCAILFWIVLPALLASDARLATAWRTPFAVLLVLMLLRGAIELWMLYVSHNWSPFYGIAHDAVCLIALGWFARRAARGVAFGQLERLERTALVHAIATAALFLPEMYFAWYMQANFRTQGDDPLYFVPDDPAHAGVLAVTTMADLTAMLYLPAFLYAWLYGKTQIAGAPAQRVER